MSNKLNRAYKTIGEVTELLHLKNKNSGKLNTHVLRYWEKEFKQIKPRILSGNRRYYDEKNILLLKKIHFLLKDQGMTINGVKRVLDNKQIFNIDESLNNSIRTNNLKSKLVKISNIIKTLKK